MTAAGKILWHRERVSAWLRGETVFPVTLELNLTTVCNRECSDCPSQAGPSGLFFPVETAAALFRLLSGHCRGLIVTGGEPTLHPEFGRILELARDHGFADIVAITNGTALGRPVVWRPLVASASAVRISLYDWDETGLAGLQPTLRRITALRRRIEQAGSRLEIGASALVHDGNAGAIDRLAEAARAAGAHWIYFHPTCIRPLADVVSSRTHGGIRRRLEECRERWRGDFPVHFLPERFATDGLVFSAYHSAHFILVVGADGVNYLGSEVKYRDRFRLADLSRSPDETRLFGSVRQGGIASWNSGNYPAGGGRNRGLLYNALTERLKDGDPIASALFDDPPPFRFPHVL